MKLTLDHTQRLDLHALMSAQPADVSSIRAIGPVQDRIALDADEEKAAEARRETVAGQSVVWNPGQPLHPQRGNGCFHARGTNHMKAAQQGRRRCYLPSERQLQERLQVWSTRRSGRAVFGQSRRPDS